MSKHIADSDQILLQLQTKGRAASPTPAHTTIASSQPITMQLNTPQQSSISSLLANATRTQSNNNTQANTLTNAATYTPPSGDVYAASAFTSPATFSPPRMAGSPTLLSTQQLPPPPATPLNTSVESVQQHLSPRSVQVGASRLSSSAGVIPSAQQQQQQQASPRGKKKTM